MLLTFPLMAAIQEISARVGRVTGHGIAGNVCRHYSSWLLNVVVTLLFIANTINIAADLGAMADATQAADRRPRHRSMCCCFGVISVVAQIFLDYKRYVVGAEMADAQPVRLCRGARRSPRCRGARRSPACSCRALTWSVDYFTTIVAIFGTTISPYLFFWQASQEAEDQRVDRRRSSR